MFLFALKTKIFTIFRSDARLWVIPDQWTSTVLDYNACESSNFIINTPSSLLGTVSSSLLGGEASIQMA